MFQGAAARMLGKTWERLRGLPKFVVILTGVALVIGGLGGAGIALAAQPQTQTRPEYVALKHDAENHVAQFEALVESRDDSITALETKLDGFTARETEIANREKGLDTREAAVKAREDAVTAAEQQVVANQITGGVLVVGTDVAPGVYKTTGGSFCYYAFKTGTGSDAGIKDNNVVQGPTTVTLRAGDIFETSSCDVWNKVG